ncbi:MAG: OsmC family protein [Hyphomicrobiales bacterium]|nr:OsmC family protein [Hyphomicrobiales bacterium]
MQAATATAPAIVNGLDMDQAIATIGAIKEDPEIAEFRFRARNRWVSGGENRSTIKDFYGARSEDSSRDKAWEFTNGEPPVLLGHNEGANPVEFLLHALAGCVTTTFVLHAAARGVTIRSLSTELEGDIDLHGLVGLNDEVAAGYREIRIKMDVDADCSDEELADLITYAEAHSPVCNTVCRPVPVKIERKS